VDGLLGDSSSWVRAQDFLQPQHFFAAGFFAAGAFFAAAFLVATFFSAMIHFPEIEGRCPEWNSSMPHNIAVFEISSTYQSRRGE